MTENNVNVHVENEEEKSPICSSNFLMNKELFYEFCAVDYNRIKGFFMALFCIITCLIIMDLLVGDYSVVFGVGPSTPLVMLFIYFLAENSIKTAYKRNLISAGKDSSLKCELFEDKIVLHVDEAKREYYYNQIIKFFETKNFILLRLQYNLFITIEKNSLDASVDDVKNFLINKCTLVKKKKFINCENDKKWALAFMIAQFVVSGIGAIVGLVLKWNSGF